MNEKKLRVAVVGLGKMGLLHEVIADMALALDLDWLFRAYRDYLLRQDIIPGHNTCNFPYLVDQFRERGLEVEGAVVATPFNRVGFQMNPSREECERTLASLNGSAVIAMSILAAGYVGLQEAADYIRTLPEISGVVVGVSNEQQACQTFRTLKRML